MVHVDRAVPRGHSTSRRRPLCNPRRRSHSIGDNHLPPCLPFFSSTSLARLLACLLASRPSPAHPPPRDSAWDRHPQAAIWFAGETFNEQTENLHLPSLVWHCHHQSRARVGPLAAYTIPHLGPDLDGTASQCRPNAQCACREAAGTPASMGDLQARRLQMDRSGSPGGRHHVHRAMDLNQHCRSHVCPPCPWL